MKKVVVSPHVDDEVLGCGGILDGDSLVYYCGIDESQVAADPGHRISSDARIAELKAACEFLGCRWELNERNKVNFYVLQDLIAQIEDLVNRHKPDLLFVPHPSYNQDHRTVYYAAQVALRPHDRNFFARRVMVYEQPDSFHWGPDPFVPNYFIPIDVERKIRAYQMHRSQVRGFRDPEFIRAMARVRGAMSDCEHAEAFRILRWCEARE